MGTVSQCFRQSPVHTQIRSHPYLVCLPSPPATLLSKPDLDSFFLYTLILLAPKFMSNISNRECLTNQLFFLFVFFLQFFSAPLPKRPVPKKKKSFLSHFLWRPSPPNSSGHWWFSGRILASHAGDPGSIPGQCIHFSISSPRFYGQYPWARQVVSYLEFYQDLRTRIYLSRKVWSSIPQLLVSPKELLRQSILLPGPLTPLLLQLLSFSDLHF